MVLKTEQKNKQKIRDSSAASHCAQFMIFLTGMLKTFCVLACVSVREDVQTSRGVPGQQGVPAGVEGHHGRHGAQVLRVRERVLQAAVLVEDLQLAGPRQAAHRETLLLLGVPHGRQLAEPAARLHVVAEEHAEDAVKSTKRVAKF